MSNIEPSLLAIGYGLCGLAFVVLVVLLSTTFSGRLRGGPLLAACAASAAWSFAIGYAGWPITVGPIALFYIEMLPIVAWLFFFSALLVGAKESGQFRAARVGATLLPVGILVMGWIRLRSPGGIDAANIVNNSIIYGTQLACLYGLVLLEQVLKNARESQRSGIKLICTAVGVFYLFDILIYSRATWTGEIYRPMWEVRGYVVAVCAPLIALAAKQSPIWSGGIFVSRQVVFYTSAFFVSCAYLAVVIVAGVYLRNVDNDWINFAQTVLFVVAVIALGVLLFSNSQRARLRVFIDKHFFENKYDYRQEWLRLINTLTATDDELPLQKRAIKALGNILHCPSGLLWLNSRGANMYSCVVGWNVNPAGCEFDLVDSLPTLLLQRGWIIDLKEFARDPTPYGDLEVRDDEFGLADPRYVIPLMNSGSLLGFIVLSEPTTDRQLNYEDRDLLKTAGQQIAGYLAQERATEQLAEAKQFEAFNRLTAYLMHDLKNVLAQQTLLVENAKRHIGNPAFINDAMDTVKGSVRRLRKVIDHLQQTAPDTPLERIELTRLIMLAVSKCADQRPVPKAELADERMWVRGERDRLLMSLIHAIRNAQDATPEPGTVMVSLRGDETHCWIDITDTGTGMDEDFVRESLFKPFCSTKGTQGMGIGAYQIRETLRAMSGDVLVDSAPGRGTRISLRMWRAGPGATAV